MYDLAHILLFYFSVPADDMFANSFLATVAWLVRADVTRNSRETFPRASIRRAWTETFAGSGRCKSRTSFHRVRCGARCFIHGHSADGVFGLIGRFGHSSVLPG